MDPPGNIFVPLVIMIPPLSVHLSLNRQSSHLNLFGGGGGMSITLPEMTKQGTKFYAKITPGTSLSTTSRNMIKIFYSFLDIKI